MTRKLAGLTGRASALLMGWILTVSFMAPPNVSLPDLRFDSSKNNAAPETEQNALLVSDPAELAPTKAEETIATEEETREFSLAREPGALSGLNKAALSVSLYGSVAKEKKTEKPATLTSLVLSSHVPATELGKFEITYAVTPEEYELLLYCVEFETRSGSIEHKALITQVIMNRVQGVKFPSTVYDVLWAPNQFDPMEKYEERKGTWTPSERTRTAVDLVLSGECSDYAQGALYFCNPYIVGEGNWFDTSLQVICELEGHRFYKPY